jgi:hypothetical protein
MIMKKHSYKPCRHPKYRTEAERIEAHKVACKKYYYKNKPMMTEKIRKKYHKIAESLGRPVRAYNKKATAVNPANPNDSLNTLGVGAPLLFEERLAALEKEVKDMLLDLEEVLKENKRLADLVRWGVRV